MAYGESKYGTLLYSGTSDTDQPGGILVPDISKQLPDVYNKAGKLRQLLDILSEEITFLIFEQKKSGRRMPWRRRPIALDDGSRSWA